MISLIGVARLLLRYADLSACDRHALDLQVTGLFRLSMQTKNFCLE